MGLPYYDLFQAIANPMRKDLMKVSEGDVNRAMKIHKVNEPQARAILGSLGTDGFSLIQGYAKLSARSVQSTSNHTTPRPPGTGKTSTIVGLVGAFMATRPTPVTKIRPGQPSRPEDRDPVKKILICAPSNAAIDEVAFRLQKGVRDSSGALVIPAVVRVGAEDKISPLVKAVSLDELVNAEMSNEPKQTDLSNLRQSLKAIAQKLTAKTTEANASGLDPTYAVTLETEIRQLRNERKALGAKLDASKDENEKVRRNRDSNYRKFETKVLNGADVICSTLSGSGHKSLANFSFETVIIDEAAQSVELSSLIPLKYGTKKAILVGGTTKRHSS